MHARSRSRWSGLTAFSLVGFLASGGCQLTAETVGPEDTAKSSTNGSVDGNTKQDADPLEGLEHRPGLFDLYVDKDHAKVLGLLPAGDERGVLAEYLYVESLASGLGSNPIGLDRGELGQTRLVQFRRVGNRVFLEQQNEKFRAHTPNRDEAAATKNSFPTSILWSSEIVEVREDGKVLVDLTSFVVRDAMKVGERIGGNEQGSFALDPERSTLMPDAVFAFPDNLEFEALLTFGGGEAGEHLRRVAPDNNSVSLTTHHSLVRLPELGFRPRKWHRVSGAIDKDFQDYATSLSEPLDVRWGVRHRLEKKNPNAAVSEPIKPIVYYVDRGAPADVQQALIEGASWWAKAFEAAGFKNAFRVELLPEGAHPLDIRYNMIQWVHRSTRGWSYGSVITDPRTGEIMKGHVSLGSLRVRQDILLFEGLAGAQKTATGSPDDPVQLALARIRQLAAHEVGHTLGVMHNFAASTYDRASVMDYPAPWVRMGADGKPDFSKAYDAGIGAWDSQAIRYLYEQFSAQDEARGLDAILRESKEKSYLYMPDFDSRSASTAHPQGSLWDNGNDPVEELRHVLEVRRYAIDHFSKRNLRVGQTLPDLAVTFAPVYFHHRYQLRSALKSLGGIYYSYDPIDVGEPNRVRLAPAKQQQRALELALSALTPEALDIPESVLGLLIPVNDRREKISTRNTGRTFDALGAASSAAQMVVDEILQPHRLARIVDQQRRDDTLPDLGEVLSALSKTVFPRKRSKEPRLAELERTVQTVSVGRLLYFAASSNVTPAVRFELESSLASLARKELRGGQNKVDRAHRDALRAQVERFLSRTETISGPPTSGSVAPPPPPGSPIGTTSRDAIFDLADTSANEVNTWGSCSFHNGH